MTQPSASWSFHSPTRVRFGAGARSALANLAARKTLMVVTTARGRRQMQGDVVLSPIVSGPDVSWIDDVLPNPGLTETQAAIDRLAGRDFDLVVAFGGGSAMDAAKALAAALTPGLASHDLARLIADPGTYLDRPLLPIVALSTTSGTGAEVTPFATIWNHEAKKKLSLASPLLFPHTAIVDPELTWGLPYAATMGTGLDAMNQAFESVWNRNASAVTRGFAGRAIGLAFDALPRLHADLDDRNARAMIAQASLLAGLAISQTRTAICHSISYPLTARFDVAHGLACALSMRAVARRVLDGAPGCLSPVAAAAGAADAADLIARLERTLDDLPLLRDTVATLPDVQTVLGLVPQMYTPGRADNFILPMDDAVLADVLRESMA